MLDYGPWIAAALKRAGKTQRDLAVALKLHPSQVSKLIKGGRRLKVEEIPVVEAVIGEPFARGFSEDAAAFAGADAPLAPIYGVVARDAGGWLIQRHEDPIDWRPRGPHFIKSAKVFGFYAPDDAMSPRFKPGEIAWVDPAKPPRPSDDVALIGKAKPGAAEPLVLAELKRATRTEIVVVQHQDQAERRFDVKRWSAFQVLARY